MKRMLALCLTLLLSLTSLARAEAAPTALGVFQALQAGDTARIYAQFDESMKKAMPEAALATMLPQLEALGGAYVGYAGEDTGEQQGYLVTVAHLLYEKSGFSFQVTWQGEKIAGLFIRPEPLPQTATAPVLPEGLTEEEVAVGPWALPGTLTLPRDMAAPLPAVVLLHGSGPNDRDETVGQTKLFRDLAWGLAERGVAVLRYDKRTLARAGEIAAGDMRAFTIREEAMEDAVAAGQLLSADARIDGSRVFLCGHSLGAMIAPRIALENPGLFSGLMLLSGTPRTLAELILAQNQAAVNALPEELRDAYQAEVDALNAQWAHILSGSGEDAKAQRIFGQPAYYLWEMAQVDTVETLSKVALPTLIIQGGADFQVTDENGIDAWSQAELPDDVTLIYYEALNHLLMRPDAPEGIGGTIAEYDIPCRTPDFILNDLSQFIFH